MTRALGICLAAALGSLASGQDYSKIAVQVIGKGFIFTEGAAWTKDGFLIFSDTPAGKLYKFTPCSGVGVSREKAQGIGGSACEGRGRRYTVQRRGSRRTSTDKGGRGEVLAK